MISRRVISIVAACALACSASITGHYMRGAFLPPGQTVQVIASAGTGQAPSGIRGVAMFTVGFSLVFFRVRRKHQAVFGETRVEVEAPAREPSECRLRGLSEQPANVGEAFATLAES